MGDEALAGSGLALKQDGRYVGIPRPVERREVRDLLPQGDDRGSVADEGGHGWPTGPLVAREPEVAVDGLGE